MLTRGRIRVLRVLHYYLLVTLATVIALAGLPAPWCPRHLGQGRRAREPRERAGRMSAAASALLDVAGATAMAIVAAPVAAVAAAALWKTQGRPLLFTQIRVGQDGRNASRSTSSGRWSIDAASQGAGMWFDRDDPRVTPVGRFLRATSIDELPQIWNVLRGDMSLVGPRPKPPEIVNRYQQPLPARPCACGPG